MSAQDKSVAEEISKIVSPVLDEMGCDLVGVEFLVDRGRWVLRIYADKEGGITVGECASASREIDHLIDINEVISHEYVLEVSSPGLNRPLKRAKDFDWAVGKIVKVKTSAPIEGRRNFKGYLKKFIDEKLFIEIDNNIFSLNRKDVEKANIVYQFDK